MFPVEIELESPIMNYIKDLINKYVKICDESALERVINTLIWCDTWVTLEGAKIRFRMAEWWSHEEDSETCISFRLMKDDEVIDEVTVSDASYLGFGDGYCNFVCKVGTDFTSKQATSIECIPEYSMKIRNGDSSFRMREVRVSVSSWTIPWKQCAYYPNGELFTDGETTYPFRTRGSNTKSARN